MTPYETISLVYRIGDIPLQWLFLAAIAISALRMILTFAFGTGKRALGKAAEHILKHDKFKAMDTKIDGLEAVTLAILGNTLNRIFYDLMDSNKFNKGLYSDFMELYTIYVDKGGNGRISVRQEALQVKWEAEIKKSM